MLRKDIGDKSVLLSIKPEYANQILMGIKKVEFRKKIFKKEVKNLIIYSSSPVKRVVAIASIKSIKKDSVLRTWRKYKSVGGITKDKFVEYYSGKEEAVAIELSTIEIFKNPITLKEIAENLVPPQSYQYLSSDKVRKLKRRVLSDVIL